MLSLEDNWSDVISKARRGLGLTHAEVAKRAGCSESELRKWESGTGTPKTAGLSALASALELAPGPLADLALGKWKPDSAHLARLKNFLQISSPYGGIIVNCYLAWDEKSREAALFDTGTDFAALRRAVDSNELAPRYLFLTHAHADHVALLDEIRSAWKPEILTSKAEFVDGGKKTAEGEHFRLGSMEIEVLETEGHSPGGLTFVVKGLAPGSPLVAVVGDALFAASVGGPNHSYEKLLSNIRRKILSLSKDTVLAPGHGPLTSVAEEREHNPFLAEMR